MTAYCNTLSVSTENQRVDPLNADIISHASTLKLDGGCFQCVSMLVLALNTKSVLYLKYTILLLLLAGYLCYYDV